MLQDVCTQYKYVHSDSLSLCLHRSNGFLRAASVTSAIYFSRTISARQATSSVERTLSDASGLGRSETITRDSILAHSRAPPLVLRVGFFPSSLSLSLFVSRARDHSHVSHAIFPSANRHRSRSRSCRNITLKLRYPFDPATGSRSSLVGADRLVRGPIHPRGLIFIGKLR